MRRRTCTAPGAFALAEFTRTGGRRERRVICSARNKGRKTPGDLAAEALRTVTDRHSFPAQAPDDRYGAFSCALSPDTSARRRARSDRRVAPDHGCFCFSG